MQINALFNIYNILLYYTLLQTLKTLYFLEKKLQTFVLNFTVIFTNSSYHHRVFNSVRRRYIIQIIQENKSSQYPTTLQERIEKKCFVWKHKVHVIDPGILLWALLRRDWLTERGTSAADKSRTAYTVARPESPSVFLTSVNAVVNFGAHRYFYL